MTTSRIINALDIWGQWHADISPLGTTGEYALDMQLADAFRALIYRPTLEARLAWIERELADQRRRRGSDVRYLAELISWWLDLFETEKMPVVRARMAERRAACAMS